ncbi:hypothetical protein [Paenibacillus polymyxa]|uniref:Uncharacterized protein n=1 Tax=Paenibacillus polymyxa (strain SC2) TaxID=886882 RepID=A0A0D5ZCP2_PAEPS|nr:hypothetical protein [Paenibacillus polymyxa]AKA44388.1 hypothetical protein PPSC2_28000 [Paenibacillus polymyxa SC2]WPQ59748.1 hypothetical protein SKN87_26020 [Paenibacillus polymyxa]
MNDRCQSYGIGDYVFVQYDKDQECPGVIRKINNNSFRVEIRAEHDVDWVDCKRGQLRPMY